MGEDWNRDIQGGGTKSSGGSALPPGSQAGAQLQRVWGLQGGAPLGHHQ